MLRKISIGSNFIDGPWGGGNNFSIQLKKYLNLKGIEVINHLNDPDIDLILITEPRKFTKISSFTHIDVRDYINNINKNTLVLNRINECDERKNTKGLNKFLINSSLVSDHTIFISKWLESLFISENFPSSSHSVIHNGADEMLFKKKELTNNKNKKVKIVTHHWGDNTNKGSKTYENLDKLLLTKNLKNKIEFTYIGNLPKNCKMNNSRIVSPIYGKQLYEELIKHDIYITGSINEPAGMHHIEGAMCGLPILYINSGGVTEYCKDFGIEFNEENLVEKIIEMINNLEKYQKKLLQYPFTGDKMCKHYLDLFEELYKNKNEILKNRKDSRKIKLLDQRKILNKYYFL